MRTGILGGWRQAHITGPYPEGLLTRLSAAGIYFWDFEKTGELEAVLSVRSESCNSADKLCKGYLVEWSDEKGIYPGVRKMKLRIIYPVLLLLLVAAVFYLQSKVWFITVEGNEHLPQEVILRSLDQCGVRMGTGEFDLYEVKNALLSKIPELSWCTINREGPLAEVVVRERTGEEAVQETDEPGNLVAALPGVIESVTVQSGSPLVKPGDIVQEGSVLISGVTDLERTVLISGASGEIVARTWRELDAILPKNRRIKSYTGRNRHLISLEIGKKTINFYKSSGISYEEYDKMKVENPLVLPGGYVLPVSLNITTLAEYRSEAGKTSMPEEIISESLRSQVQNSLLAGVILDMKTDTRECNDSYHAASAIECREEIGRVVKIWNEGS